MSSSDIDIVTRVIHGETALFRVLVQRYEQRVLGFVRNLIHDRHLAEDVAQETFLAAYEGLRTWDPTIASLATWLMTIARNKAVKAIRRKRPAVMSRLPDSPEERDPSAPLEQREFFAQLDAALNALPFPQKSAFVMAEIQGLSYEEISRIENVRLGTVKSRVARAKEKLREILRAIFGFVS